MNTVARNKERNIVFNAVSVVLVPEASSERAQKVLDQSAGYVDRDWGTQLPAQKLPCSGCSQISAKVTMRL
jgi:hypothetical protein